MLINCQLDPAEGWGFLQRQLVSNHIQYHHQVIQSRSPLTMSATVPYTQQFSSASPQFTNRFLYMILCYFIYAKFSKGNIFFIMHFSGPGTSPCYIFFIAVSTSPFSTDRPSTFLPSVGLSAQNITFTFSGAVVGSTVV